MFIVGNIKEVEDFLKAIGRGCDEFAGKFEVCKRKTIL